VTGVVDEQHTNAPAAPLPPQNLDAEESVLGALMLSQGALEAVGEIVKPGDFYRESHGTLYRAALSLHAKGEPVDAITLTDELDRRGDLERVGGQERVHEIASLVPSTSNAAHYARIVVEMATLRALVRVGNDIVRLGFDRPAETAQLVTTARDLVEQIETRAVQQLEPLWWHDAIHEPLPAVRHYVEGVLQTGILADIVGLPYLHKTAVALELARKVANGTGELLGQFPIRQQANVGYFWSDDSRENELERIQAYAGACAEDIVPVAFYLNSGLTLPAGIPTLKQQIRKHDLRLVLLDSLYNFAPGIDWVKDTGAVGGLYAALKRLCDEIAGLTIVLVDHAAKPSDSNRGRDASVSSFGSVWKAAAVRTSIVITKENGTLYAQAIGNNVKGFPRTPVVFNDTALELRVVETKEPDPEREEEIEERVLEWIGAHPGQSTNKIARSVKGRGVDVAAAVRRLERKNLILDTYGTSSQLPGSAPEEVRETGSENLVPDESGGGRTKGKKTAWIPLNQAEKPPPDLNGSAPEELAPRQGSSVPPESSSHAPPYVVGGAGEALRAGEPSTSDDDSEWLA
jgi:hypothetical protein